MDKEDMIHAINGREHINHTKESGLLASLVESISAGKYFDAIKMIGVLEYCGDQNIPYYSGLVKFLMGDVKGAVEEYKKTDEKSDFYVNAVRGLVTCYIHLGDLEGLKASMQADRELSPMIELQHIIQCLENIMKKAITDDKESASIPEPVEVRSIIGFGEKKEEKRAFYNICRMLTDMLVLSGECVNQCGIYCDRAGISGSEVDKDLNTRAFIKCYDFCVYILSYSKYLKSIQIQGSVDSLADCALSGISWEEKIRILQGTDHARQIAQIVLQLLSPELHRTIDRYSLAKDGMDKIVHIKPAYIQAVINYSFDSVVEAAKAGDPTAVQYLGFAYAQLLADNNDLYNLRDKIDIVMKNQLELDYEEIEQRINLTKNMSRRGHDAMLNAEAAFEKTIGSNFGTNDASALALMFFRVFEFEYNDKLIKPLVKALDIENMKKICEMEKAPNEWREPRVYRMYKAWNKDIKMLDACKNAENRDTLEIGKIRILLTKIKEKNDTCSKELFNVMTPLLTNEGLQAFLNGDMTTLISQTNLDRYRNPGAHTGFVPYSGACEAREIVREKLPELEKWFVGDHTGA